MWVGSALTGRVLGLAIEVRRETGRRLRLGLLLNFHAP